MDSVFKLRELLGDKFHLKLLWFRHLRHNRNTNSDGWMVLSTCDLHLYQEISCAWLVQNFLSLAAVKQFYEWFSPSVCPSVRSSHLFQYVLVIVSLWNFQLLTLIEVMSLQKVKVKGHRGKTNFAPIRVCPDRKSINVFIHGWPRKDGS